MENDRFFKSFNSKVEKLVNDGTNTPQAISIIAKKLGLNPYKIMQKYYPNIDTENNNSFDDIKTIEGSFVTLKGDSDKNQYEVINIINKDAIVLRNTDNNEEIVASENELTPVITENRMNKINEAQYSISINGLETQDAGALSQMLDAANKAESSVNTSVDGIGQFNPTPMDTDTGMPMDMNEPEEVVDDIEFDEELPMDSVADDSMSDFNNSDMGDMAMISAEEAPMENDSIEDMSMDSMMDNGMYDDEINEVLKQAGIKLDEAEEIIPGDDIDEDDEDDGSEEGEQDKYAEDITENAVNQAINAAEDMDFDESDDEIVNEADSADLLDGYKDNVDGFMSDYFYDNAELQSEYDSDLLEQNKNEIFAKWKELISGGENEWAAAEDAANDVLSNANYDDEINEVLKCAGIKLDEDSFVSVPRKDVKKVEKADKSSKTKYHKVDTDTFNKEASEGAKCSMTCESTVNKDKIKSIYETAKRMYAKKDVSEWNSLDRRYIEKLIKEGCSYGTSTKMLMEAKKGK